jgi:hypothetical protein
VLDLHYTAPVPLPEFLQDVKVVILEVELFVLRFGVELELGYSA